MNKKIIITINKKKYSAKEGDTILNVANKNGLYIPTLCYHPDLAPGASCRICLVEAKIGDEYKIVCSCETKAVDGMQVKLDGQKVKKSRKLNLELLLSDHSKKCDDCNWEYQCQLKKLASDFGLKNSRFSQRRRRSKIDQKTDAIFWDSSKCIECNNCVSTCQNIVGLNNIESKYSGPEITYSPIGGKTFADTNCVLCGQCILRCPSGALQEKSEINQVEKILKSKKKKQILVAQFAPSTRYSIGELFGAKYGENLEKKLVTALKEIGFDFVFDVNFGADITTVEEAEELIEKINSKEKLPMFTSCCPSWVRYVEIFHHDIIPYLTTTKSPNQCLGSAVKSYFAKKEKVRPSNIKIVAIMPCVAKKYESKLKDFQTSAGPDIDFTLTVREMAKILKDRKIQLTKLTESEFDPLLGNASGAGVIYGSSGGVMESALRTLTARLSSAELGKIQFKQVRGLSGIKESSVEIDGRAIEVAVVSGLKNAARLLKDLRSGVKSYDYIEVMACPGGCLGGGGQPIPTTPEIRQKRSGAYYTDDSSKAVRRAHENKDLQKMYQGINAKPGSSVAEKLFHRKFSKRRKK